MAELQVRIAGGTDREGGGSGPVVVLLHGFGARGDDLAPLYRVLDVPREVRFVFPEAPLAPPEFASFGGRAWWAIDTAAMQHAVMTGVARDRTRETPPGLDGGATARARAARRGGARARRGRRPARARRLLAGRDAVARRGTAQRARARRARAAVEHLAVPQRMGAADARAAEGCRCCRRTAGRTRCCRSRPRPSCATCMQAAGCAVEWHEFNGGHEVPMPVLAALAAFVRRVVDAG